MRKTWKRAVFVAFVWAAAGLALAHEPARGKIAKDTKTLRSPGEVKWAPMAGLPGAQEAALWGDPTKGEHGMLYRSPAARNVPVHWHTHGDHGVVISGTMALAVDGAPPKVQGLPAAAPAR